MATYDVDARKVGALILSHERGRQESMRGAIRASVKAAVNIIKSNTPVAFEDLKKSVHAEGNEVVVDAPHAVAVEVGSRPHVAPLAPIIAWAYQVGGDREMAGAVWKKIATEGTRPRWFVRGSIPAIMQATGAKIQYVLKK